MSFAVAERTTNEQKGYRVNTTKSKSDCGCESYEIPVSVRVGEVLLCKKCGSNYAKQINEYSKTNRVQPISCNPLAIYDKLVKAMGGHWDEENGNYVIPLSK